MIGALPAGIVQGLFPQGQMQTAAEPFVYGQGGRRMTPEDIARERAMSARMMQSDYSPVSHWAQGLGRVADGLLGGMKAREADQATAANQAYSEDRMAQLLLNPSGSPSASAPPGAASSSMPGGNLPLLMQTIADPYVGANTKALAKRQIDMADFEQKQRLQSQYGEQPEIVRLAQVAGDMSRSPAEREAAAGRIKALNDPEIVIPGLPGGTYIGPRSGVGMAYGQAPAVDAPDTLPPDFFDEGAPPVSAAPPPPDAAALSRARAEADAWMKLNGMVPR